MIFCSRIDGDMVIPTLYVVNHKLTFIIRKPKRIVTFTTSPEQIVFVHNANLAGSEIGAC